MDQFSILDSFVKKYIIYPSLSREIKTVEMERIEEFIVLPQNNLRQPIFDMQPARIDMAVVEPANIPIFPAPPYAVL